MKLTFPIYITIETPDAPTGRRQIEGLLRSDLLLKKSWAIGRPFMAALTETKSADSFSARRPQQAT